MTDRRITTKTEHDQESRLKRIAGLVKKLTFAEMNELAKLIHEDVDVSDRRTVPYGLLKIADRILETKTGISL